MYEKIPLDGEVLLETNERRREIIDLLSGFDDELADHIIKNNTLDDINNSLILKAMRRHTISQQIVPVFLGSAYKNTGIQPLIDSVLSLLPAPSERNLVYRAFG